ncbi:MAG: hypothetical protein AAF208_11275 [Cyanobacteria bacterium P01_A01_bin.45]
MATTRLVMIFPIHHPLFPIPHFLLSFAKHLPRTYMFKAIAKRHYVLPAQ